jgi:hypothetical protein
MVVGGAAGIINIPYGVFIIKIDVKAAVRKGNFPRHSSPRSFPVSLNFLKLMEIGETMNNRIQKPAPG